MLQLSLLFAIGLAAFSLADGNNHLDLYSNHNCTLNYANLTIARNDACYSPLPENGHAKAIAAASIQNGCYGA